MIFLYILGIIIWIALAFLPARIASGKGYSFFLYFLLSLPFWWITLFVAIFLKPKTPAAAATSE